MAHLVVDRLRQSDLGVEKFCTRCSEWWPADTEFFWADPAGQGGLFYCCKACYHRMDKRSSSRRGYARVVPVGEGAGGPALADLGAVLNRWAASSSVAS